MNIKTDVYLNQLGQGLISKVSGIEWFKVSSLDFQIDVLRRLVYFILQMGGVGSYAEVAVELSGLKATYTPCQL